MVIFESEFGKIILFTAKITFYSLLLAAEKVLVRNCGCSQKIGDIKLTEVEDSYAEGEIISGSGFNVGDIVR